jgi:zinc transporter ZupT
MAEAFAWGIVAGSSLGLGGLIAVRVTIPGVLLGLVMAFVLGIVLDGIPETAVIGLSLLEGGGVSVAVIAAVFLSNLPESIAATTGLAKSGWKASRILVL